MKEKTTTQKFKVGQKLYKQESNYGGVPRISDATIRRVGKKYLYLVERPECQICRSTLIFRNPNGYEKFYTDKEELMEYLNKEYFWNRARAILWFLSPPKNLTLEQIRTAALALGAVKEENVNEI